MARSGRLKLTNSQRAVGFRRAAAGVPRVREETIKIGVNTWVWTSPFSTKEFHLIPKVRQMGFDVLEVALDDASIIDGKLLRKMTEDNGLSVTVCGAFGPTRDISNEDPSFRPNPGY